MPVRQNVPHMNGIINKYPGVQQQVLELHHLCNVYVLTTVEEAT